MRMTPMPPRPGGVAIATMVSEVENTYDGRIRLRQGYGGQASLPLFHRDDDRLFERVADALGADRLELGNRKVHDAALVRIERADFLRQAGVFGLAAEEQRHLPKLFVLAFAIPHAIDHQPASFGGLMAIHRGDDVLPRG